MRARGVQVVVLALCAQGPIDAHDRRGPRASPTEEALNPTDQRALAAFSVTLSLAWYPGTGVLAGYSQY